MIVFSLSSHCSQQILFNSLCQFLIWQAWELQLTEKEPNWRSETLVIALPIVLVIVNTWLYFVSESLNLLPRCLAWVLNYYCLCWHAWNADFNFHPNSNLSWCIHFMFQFLLYKQYTRNTNSSSVICTQAYSLLPSSSNNGFFLHLRDLSSVFSFSMTSQLRNAYYLQHNISVIKGIGLVLLDIGSVAGHLKASSLEMIVDVKENSVIPRLVSSKMKENFDFKVPF